MNLYKNKIIAIIIIFTFISTSISPAFAAQLVSKHAENMRPTEPEQADGVVLSLGNALGASNRTIWSLGQARQAVADVYPAKQRIINPGLIDFSRTNEHSNITVFLNAGNATRFQKSLAKRAIKENNWDDEFEQFYAAKLAEDAKYDKDKAAVDFVTDVKKVVIPSKIRYPFMGRPLAKGPLHAAKEHTGIAPIAIVGYQSEEVMEAVGKGEYVFIRQPGFEGDPPNIRAMIENHTFPDIYGTGYAVAQACDYIPDSYDGLISIAMGDVPLFDGTVLSDLETAYDEASNAPDGQKVAGVVLAGTIENPERYTYGRLIIRSDNTLDHIIENKSIYGLMRAAAGITDENKEKLANYNDFERLKAEGAIPVKADIIKTAMEDPEIVEILKSVGGGFTTIGDKICISIPQNKEYSPEMLTLNDKLLLKKGLHRVSFDGTLLTGEDLLFEKRFNPAMYLLKYKIFNAYTNQIVNDNEPREHYGTDLFKLLNHAGYRLKIKPVSDILKIEGLDTVAQLETLEQKARAQVSDNSSGMIAERIEEILNIPAIEYAKTINEPLDIAVIFSTGNFDIDAIKGHEAIAIKVKQLQRLADANPKLKFTIFAGNDKPGNEILTEIQRQFDETLHSDSIQLVLFGLQDALDGKRTEPEQKLFENNLSGSQESRKWGTMRLGIYNICAANQFDFCIMTDSDTDLDLTQIPNLLRPMIENSSISAVNGSRFKPGSIRNIHTFGQEMETAHYYPRAYQVLGVPALTGMDIGSACKALRVNDILMHSVEDMGTNNFAGDPELLLLLYLRGGELTESPVSVYSPVTNPDDTISTVPRDNETYTGFLREIIKQRNRHSAEYAKRSLNIPTSITEIDHTALEQLGLVDLNEVREKLRERTAQLVANTGSLHEDLIQQAITSSLKPAVLLVGPEAMKETLESLPGFEEIKGSIEIFTVPDVNDEEAIRKQLGNQYIILRVFNCTGSAIQMSEAVVRLIGNVEIKKPKDPKEILSILQSM